jgi:hypothetical protein
MGNRKILYSFTNVIRLKDIDLFYVKSSQFIERTIFNSKISGKSGYSIK